MKNIVAIVLLACLFSCSNRYENVVNAAQDYPIIPKPNEMTISNGRFLVESNTKIITDKVLEGEALYLAEILAKGADLQLDIIHEGSDKGNIKMTDGFTFNHHGLNSNCSLAISSFFM